MTSPRQQQAEEITRALFAGAASAIEPPPHVGRALDLVVASGSRGLRELLLLVVVARIMEPNFRASRDYDACSPRGLYPAIKKVLSEESIPRGKDGALNVAKGNPPIDRQWAGARKDQAAADEVVRLVSSLEGMNTTEVKEFGSQLAKRLLAEATRVATLTVTVTPSQDPEWLARACRRLIERAPDRGNTPQTLAGLLLEARAAAMYSPVTVQGIGDSACVTTSTSRKLGDLCVLDPGGQPLVAYEVTIKPFGPDRVTDCTDAIHDYRAASGADVTEMMVLCRPDDVHPVASGADGSAYLGTVDDQDVRYQFIDLYEWMRLELLDLPSAGRRAFHEAITSYVNDPNVSEAVKAVWAQINA